ncbi:MAG: hypothetical protein BWK80_21990 [Desulfobacteraceae bacterium IS3]|nr:MAG: hypothetical protein BWK80_21990 [Desulfobacteraceae bacterium IS3]
MLCIFFAGCTAAPLRQARKSFYAGKPAEAVNALSEAKNFPSRDRLLLFMEKGLILHHLGRYEESANTLLKASELMEKQEIISISQQAASFITNEWVTEYKGEYSERLWVHTYLMMNFLLLRKYESALVEAKQSLKILEKHPEPLSKDHFTRALIALCFENFRQYSDAYIEYKKIAENLPDPSPVAPRIYEIGMNLGFREEAEKYKKFIPPDIPSILNSQFSILNSELVLFVSIGSAPEKISGSIIIPPSIRFSFPQYEDKIADDAQVSLAGAETPPFSVTTHIGNVAKASLQDRAAKIIAKETARAAMKESIARAVEHKNEGILSVLLRMAFFLMEEPDTRCWETLPAYLKLFRFPIQPGKHRLKAVIYQNGIRKDIILPQFSLSAGQKYYYQIRINSGSAIGN